MDEGIFFLENVANVVISMFVEVILFILNIL